MAGVVVVVVVVGGGWAFIDATLQSASVAVSPLCRLDGRAARPLDPAPQPRDRAVVQSELTHAIVPAGPADAAELARVHVQAWRETYAGILPGDYLDRLSMPLHARRWRARLMRMNEITLVAEGRGGLVAYASGQASRGGDPAEGEITTLYVLRAAQNAGLGRLLLTGVARALADGGAASLVIWVLRENILAQRFYERMGGEAAEAGEETVGGGVARTVAYRWWDIRALVG
jgi:ribosomal protein S18 acetylase RimI-like enzyme